MSHVQFEDDNPSRRYREAAYILNIYLNPPSNLIFNPAFSCEEKRKSIRIIELGSGSGMVGINVALSLKLQLGDRLVLTDLSEVPVYLYLFCVVSKFLPCRFVLYLRVTWKLDARTPNYAI